MVDLLKFSLSVAFDAMTISDMARLMAVNRSCQQFIVDNMEYATPGGTCVADKFLSHTLDSEDIGNIKSLQHMCEINDWIFKYVMSRARDPQKMQCIDINTMLSALMQSDKNLCLGIILDGCVSAHEAYKMLLFAVREPMVCINSPRLIDQSASYQIVPRILTDLGAVKSFKTDRGEFIMRLNAIFSNFKYVCIGWVQVDPEIVYLRSFHADRPEPNYSKIVRFQTACEMDMAHFKEWLVSHCYEFIM